MQIWENSMKVRREGSWENPKVGKSGSPKVLDVLFGSLRSIPFNQARESGSAKAVGFS